MNANLPPGVRERDLDDDLHAALPDDTEERLAREDEAYDRAQDRALFANEN